MILDGLHVSKFRVLWPDSEFLLPRSLSGKHCLQNMIIFEAEVMGLFAKLYNHWYQSDTIIFMCLIICLSNLSSFQKVYEFSQHGVDEGRSSIILRGTDNQAFI